MTNIDNEFNRVYYSPGDLVTVRHEKLANKPVMYVIEKVTKSFVTKTDEKENMFLGIKCRWFSTDGKLQEAVFSTKDLIHV